MPADADWSAVGREVSRRRSLLYSVHEDRSNRGYLRRNPSAIIGGPSFNRVIGPIPTGSSTLRGRNRMESLGLVRRMLAPQDKRQALLSLTTDALQMLENLSATHREEIRRLRPTLTQLLGLLEDS